MPGYERTDSTYEYVVRVVPNPYIVFNPWETTTSQRIIKFTNLPGKCVIRVFTLSGDLVKVIRHRSVGEQPLERGGTATWDLLNDNQQLIASGVYVYHVESDIGEYTGKFAFIH